ncbi:phospholipase D-like domain-containing protein [Alicycliphilus denitrificans]|uniref:phospholipase D-like domain-containing protein n=1 Tax=Alicycliphilus denitrificans TaxID=179636 RepID=UPI0001F69743|nr:phospholipase D-like domain-containing protein [Alicycliphilus denitrificans]ADV01837.1 hypothetical protein Alide_4134 [Alicycliphilus denitrificans BC]
MSTLLYHPPDNPVEESPFDRAILELAKGRDVKIVSPYISLSYLERIIRVSQSWRLISDVLEWLSATPARERNAAYEFLKCHEGLVHHYPAIHAKTVISQAAAYTGSANLTDAGVLRRTEFGVVLREKAQIDEIHRWFAALWDQTSPPSLAGVRELITWLNQLSAPAEDTLSAKGTYLESNALKVRARLVKVLGEHPVSIATRLVERHETSKKALQIKSLAKESEPFDIDATVSSFIEKHAELGFSFSELHSALMGLSGNIRVRETYFAVLNYCASRPQSIFSEDAVNRLVYRQGLFLQSSKEYLDEALAPLDVLLEWLFKSLSFSEQRPLPASAPTALAPQPPHAAYRLLVRELATGGFIHLEQGARLNDQASWSPRLRLLTRAYLAWETSLAKHRIQMAATLGMVMKAALTAAQRKQSDVLFAQLLQLAITHGNPLPPNRLTGAVSDIQQQADTVLRKVNELCRRYPDTVRPVITLQRPSDRPSYIDVVLQVKHEDDLSFLPMTAKLLASPSLTMKRVRQTTEA